MKTIKLPKLPDLKFKRTIPIIDTKGNIIGSAFNLSADVTTKLEDNKLNFDYTINAKYQKKYSGYDFTFKALADVKGQKLDKILLKATMKF